MKILVLNSGSSSLKYQLIDADTEDVLARGIAERIAVKGGGGKVTHEASPVGRFEVTGDMADHDEAIRRVFDLLTDPEKGAVSSVREISAVGHRVVHGGEKFVESTIVNEEILSEIEKMSTLAPLHNPPNLEGIRACIRLMPGVPQVAVFDTAFHATMPDYAYTYALPYNYYSDYRVRRYGFHGTSHRYVAGEAQQLLKERGLDLASTKIITCHLGNGCSITAIVGGKVVDTSMGMTPAEGLMMGTRGGDIDPGILVYLAREHNATPDEIDELINKRSGLLGVSGVSSDMRDVQKAAAEGSSRAQLALAMFCYRIKKYIGAYAAAMGGLDAIVFTGGIGENSSEIRASVCDGLEFLGVKLDPDKNNYPFEGDASSAVTADITTDASLVKVFVIRTNEERMIARETAEVVRKSGVEARR
ncbi:MAG: acetate kinase [Armatimonadetes bacterium]|nr:acetate kinase [Armatimonadota bacterium]